MATFCVGCGGAVDAAATTCPACEDPIRGHAAPGAVTLRTEQALRLPDVCCCCLNPASVRLAHTFKLNGTQGVVVDVHRSLVVELPWCAGCARTSRLSALVRIVAGAVAGALGVAVGALAYHGDPLIPAILAVAAAVGFWFGLVAVAARLPAFHRPGHVAMCKAFDRTMEYDSQATQITLKNYGFVKRWRELNGED